MWRFVLSVCLILAGVVPAVSAGGPQRIAILGGRGTVTIGPGGAGGGYGSTTRLVTMCLDGGRSAPRYGHRYTRVLGSLGRGFGDPIVSGLPGGPRALSLALSRGDVSLRSDGRFSRLTMVNNRPYEITVQFGTSPVVVGADSDEDSDLSAATIPHLSDLHTANVSALAGGSEENAQHVVQLGLWAYRDAAALGFGDGTQDPTPAEMRRTIQRALQAFDWRSEDGVKALGSAAELRRNNANLDPAGSVFGLLRRRRRDGGPEYLIVGPDGRPRGAWMGVGTLAPALTGILLAGNRHQVYLKVIGHEADTEEEAVLSDVTANGDLRSRGVRAVRIDGGDKVTTASGGGSYLGFFTPGLIRLEDVTVTGLEATTRVMYAATDADRYFPRFSRQLLERVLRVVTPSRAVAATVKVQLERELRLNSHEAKSLALVLSRLYSTVEEGHGPEASLATRTQVRDATDAQAAFWVRMGNGRRSRLDSAGDE